LNTVITPLKLAAGVAIDDEPHVYVIDVPFEPGDIPTRKTFPSLDGMVEDI
jgi:hypothetical protein